MQSRVYETVECPSIRPSNRYQQWGAASLLLSAPGRISIDSRRSAEQQRRRAAAPLSAANAGSAVLTAKERG